MKKVHKITVILFYHFFLTCYIHIILVTTDMCQNTIVRGHYHCHNVYVTYMTPHAMSLLMITMIRIGFIVIYRIIIIDVAFVVE